MKREMFWPLSALVLAFSLSGEWYLIADTLKGPVYQREASSLCFVLVFSSRSCDI